MIRLRLASFRKTDQDLEIPIVDNSILSDVITKLLQDKNITEDATRLFAATVNGKLIHSDLWPFTKLNKEDSVFIAPKMGDARNIGQILVTVAVVVASAYTGGAVATGAMSFLQAGLINAGVALVSSYLVSQLIPPPTLDLGFGGGSVQNSSQMYSISSQSNSVRKYGFVPKVYGKHRMFPIVAANPYTELEADPNTGVFSQYFYCIYDFGLGPVDFQELKIGNTLIGNFDQVSYNLVDPNKPLVNEGPWDEVTQREFTLYKGDVSAESVGTSINGNENESDPVDDYQLTRNAATNGSLRVQEITLNLVCPRGLYAFDSYGNISNRDINLFVEFSKADVEDWKPFNDPATVSKWSLVGGGGSQQYTDVPLQAIPPNSTNPNLLTVYGESATATPYVRTFQNFQGPPFNITTYVDQRTVYRGYPTGSTSVVLSDGGEIGKGLKFQDKKFGTIATKVFHSTVLGVNYYTYGLTSPTTFPMTVLGYTETRLTTIGPPLFTPVVSTSYEAYYISTAFYREVIVPGKFQIRAATQEPHFATLKFTPIDPDEYKIRITRQSTSSSATTNVMDELTLQNIVTRADAGPIRTTKRHTFLEIRIKATGQLNGAIQNLSAVCTSVLDVYNGSSWEKQVTNNPAWIFADILTGEAAKRPLDKSRLHTDSLMEWADYCDETPSATLPIIWTEKRFTSNFILDFDTTVQQLLQQVANTAQATPNMIDGKYGILLDINRTTPVQVFTPRNSFGFSSTKNFTVKPHALKVSYVDPSADWQPREIIVYDDSYNFETATEFQEISTFGVTSVEQATRFGRYFMAQHRLRQETFTIKVDFENLVCTRGDFVQITQDVMKVGGTPARVKSISGNQITIDDKIVIVPGSYGYVFRSPTNGIQTNTLTVVDSETFDLNGSPLPQVGDLIVIGIVGQIVFDCIVKAVIPEHDMTATLQLVEKSSAIYDYESVSVLADYDPQIRPTPEYEDSAPPQVTNLQVTDNYYELNDTGIDYFISLDWDMPIGSSFEAFEIYVDDGTGYDLYTVIKKSEYIYQVATNRLNIEHKFKVLAVSSTGKKLALGEVGFVAATPLEYVQLPPDVEDFTQDISGEIIQLSWRKISGFSITSYMIRYSPDFNGSWEYSTILNTVDSNTNLYSTQARVGRYFIKAINSNGDESSNAAIVNTSVTFLPDFNLVDTIDDFPALAGTTDRTIKSDVIVLDQSVFGEIGNEQFYADGYYFLNSALTFDYSYLTRLRAAIIASGLSYADLILYWETLADIPSLATVASSDWDAEFQYRFTNSFTPIADWVTLDSVPVIGADDQPWSSWRKFTVTDVEGKYFQFRLKLTSFNPSVTPRVISAKVYVEMKNREENFGELTATPSGLVVNYANAFFGPGTTPNVQITPTDGQSGDRYEFVDKDLEGFEIVFYDNLNNAVTRSFDATAKGFGRRTA